jgi:hypothetical protein
VKHSITPWSKEAKRGPRGKRKPKEERSLKLLRKCVPRPMFFMVFGFHASNANQQCLDVATVTNIIFSRDVSRFFSAVYISI